MFRLNDRGKQLPLNGFDMRPHCPACKRQAGVLGQWAAGDRGVFVCRECYETYAPPDVFVVAQNSVGVGLIQDNNRETVAMREQYHERVNVLKDLARGCLYTIRDAQNGYLPCHPIMGHEAWSNCRLCMRRAKLALTGGRYGRMKAQRNYTLSLPLCQRCGCAHSERYTHTQGYQPYCPECDAKLSVEAFYRHRGVFGDDDDESVLDRIQSSHPELFEVGVLPDYWFELRRASSV